VNAAAPRTIGIGLIGASRVATYAIIDPARDLPGVKITAIAARDPCRAENYAATHAIARWHGDYAALIADEAVDLVYLGTPPSRHSEQALAAIAVGKAVLVEKPLAMNAAEARAVLASAQDAGVLVVEAMHSLHHALFDRLHAIIASGAIGRLERIAAEFSVPIAADDAIRWDAVLGGGALMDLGVYPLAWARAFAGDSFDVVGATAVMERGVDAAFAARMQFASGVSATVQSSMRASTPVATLELVGSEGRICVQNPLAPQRGHTIEIEASGRCHREQVTGPSSYAAQLSAVRDAMFGITPLPRPADDFIHSMEAIDRVRRAMTNSDG